MTKKEFIDLLAKQMKGFSRKDCEEFLNVVIKCILDVMISKKELKLSNFATFYTQIRQSKNARDPRNGTVVKVPSRIIPKIKYSQYIKKLLNEAPAATKTKK